MRIRSQVALALCLATLAAGVGCSRLRAKAAFKEGNRAYEDKNFRDAIAAYERTVSLDPDMAEAYFYLANSHQALYRPAREGAENREHLDKALENYKKSLELNRGDTEPLRKVKANTLASLVGLYSDDPFKNFDQAYAYASQLVQENPDDVKNLYAMANLYRKFEKFTDAEQTYAKIVQQHPGDQKACAALADFYNQPYWDGRSRFDDTVATLQKCASLSPTEPAGYHRLAAFYWEKAFKDPMLTDPERLALADKGLVEIEKAIEINPEYVDALVYKGLLYRVKARFTREFRERNRYQDDAEKILKEVERLRKEKQAAAPSPSPAAGTPGT